MHLFPFIFPLLFFFFITNISINLGQQPYIGLSTTACPRKGDSKSIRGYTCNGQTHTCQAYLTFRSQPIYSSVSTISSLLGSNPSQLAEINSVSLNETFETNKMVIVPVNCSCSGNYYQANTSYVFQNTDTYFLVANNTFEGLSTCQALMHENHNPADIYPGRKLLVPLRCACPTKNQTENNIKYLLSYLVDWGDSVAFISGKFGVNFKTTLVANTLTLTQSTIYPFTTLLVPLFDKPKSSQIQAHQQPSPSSTSPSSSPSTDRKSKKTLVYVVVGVLGGLVVIGLALILFALFFFKKGKEKDDFSVNVSESTIYSAKEKPVKKEEEKLLESIISGIGQSFKVYDFEEIKVATDDFSPSFLIKGCVYRGVIKGDLAAIKKTEGDVSKEIQILNKVNHSNVIRLSGVSFNEGHWYLVYEYAANGSLSDWIFSNKKMSDEKFLSWIQRMKIALDVATGVEYLHSFTSPPYIHKDLKCTNVLLDNDFKAKVASLRLARCVGGLDNDDDEQFVATRHIVGTRGYMAPEYLENGIVSTKLDVYAFGVLMLEIVTGKEVAAILAEGNENLIDFLSGDEKLKDLIDSSLRGNYPFELAMFVIEIVENCLKKDPGNRPTMDEIVSALSRTLNSSLSWEMSVNVAR
ncbi:lysM domain receptor-like kinase 4 [Vicia villosa]|uniref:lysM domain receptor-like kinase 4 n=1 Tax=Vicia villosa TaxID=3911 RepID=UPI00273BD66E|nr:lysM domain receptor-like kinase 4 [Vicia villosa]